MANIKSSKKRIKIIHVKNARNKAYKSAMRTAIKNVVTAEDSTKEKCIREAVKKIDMAVSKGILHKNTAARKKSKLMIKNAA